ncbi:MAG: carbohydrate ABC transporter permease [Spirochaetae bacterium HGW-Spirochaetae-3]|jgi:putative aldouronate transport system permease protein|nr:MAG: carbohydrate ABC transporter permease [Spirochaetae bacterium HGW-Spirochaetae-3]
MAGLKIKGKPSSTRDRLFRATIALILVAVSAVVLVPLLNLLALSLSDPARVGEVTGLSILPKGFSTVNYRVLAANPLFVRSILNALFITVVGTAINLVVTSMAAFALTRANLPGRRFFMLLVIVIMVLEPGLIPEYLVVKKIGLMNSLWAVILYKTVNVYYLIILMRFFEEVPQSLIEAARVDGAGYGTIFLKIMLPLAKPALATLGLFYGVFHWNEYFRASIYLSDPDKYPLQLILRQFVVLDDTASLIGSGALFSYEEAARLDYGALKASTIIVAMLPVLIVYPLILKYYTKGVMEGGVKE